MVDILSKCIVIGKQWSDDEGRHHFTAYFDGNRLYDLLSEENIIIANRQFVEIIDELFPSHLFTDWRHTGYVVQTLADRATQDYRWIEKVYEDDESFGEIACSLISTFNVNNMFFLYSVVFNNNVDKNIFKLKYTKLLT